MEYKPKKYYIKTYGCQANHADSSKIEGILEVLGFERSKNLSEADVLIINTCSVRQKSEDKVFGFPQKIENIEDKPFIILAGCMVGSVVGKRQRYSFKKLKNKTSWVNAYISPDQIDEIPNILKTHGLVGEWGLDVDFKNYDLIQKKGSQNNIGYVNISYGCDNFCTFCVVPYAREKEISREPQEIFVDIKKLTDKGFDHIMLCGQNVNSWGLSPTEKLKTRTATDQKLPFADLLRDVHKLDEVRKISFLSSNPFDFTQDLIEAVSMPKIEDYLHIAVQSGNNDVLKRMNRRHTIEDFTYLIKEIKKVKPNVRLGTDVIVGFPGETKGQFMEFV